ncbi:septum formation initiator family protein [Anoxynatronum buryatiense]|uniref:Septum formation initiator n=1 Tax=Anoxynatronum buryatiense TaxID=489973 RepID=A0AA45WV35_9CLOT|nr:septum formation initiator family protein [Anoxynatronum buryatiense]SMP46612.1 Septum formation initiator [Anoxynatronum buryatiense]
MYAAERIREMDYDDYRQMPKRQQTASKKAKPQKSYMPETCALLLCIVAFLGLNLFLINRFAEITATKHQVTQLEKSLEQLQNQREQLMVEIEQSSKLEWIEQEAVNRLGMRYPDKSQLIYISVDPASVALLAGEIQEDPLAENEDGGLLPYSIEKIFHKFAGILRI